LAELADAVIEVAADEANPKVTVLPSHTRPQCGQGRVRARHGMALGDRERAVRGSTPILPGAWECGNEQFGTTGGKQWV
jgi:hypothetical protein